VSVNICVGMHKYQLSIITPIQMLTDTNRILELGQSIGKYQCFFLIKKRV